MDRFADALNSLPEPQKQAVILHTFQGKTITEIADRLGRSPAEVAMLIHRGLRKLRTAIAERDP